MYNFRATKVSVVDCLFTFGSSRYPGSFVPFNFPSEYCARSVLCTISSGESGRNDRNTLLISLRIASVSKEEGGSIAINAMICMR